jgi:hypothetical protein
MESPSVEMPRRSPSALIAAVVILDLGLAAAGAMLLVKGLEKPAAETKSQPAPPPAAAPTPPAPKSATSEPVPDPSPAVAAPAPAAALVAAVAAAPPKDRHHRKVATTKKGSGTGSASSPLDPYDADTEGPSDPAPSDPGPSLATEIERKAAASRGVFDLCRSSAGDVHGTIQIAFRIESTGHVAHIAPVENSTNNPQLATCLCNTIAAWQFAPRTGAAVDFVRPFQF